MSEYKVLIPLDGSRYAEHALAYLPAMRRMGDVSLELLAVVDETGRTTNQVEPTEQELRERNLLQSYLDQVASDVHQHLNVTATTDVLQGNPAEIILEKARRFSPDVVVISTHGRSGLQRWRRGSVADKLIRTLQRPVLTLGPRAMEQGQWLEAEVVPPFQRILVPLDGSDLAEKALPEAARFAQQFGSQVHLFQVVPIRLSGDGLEGVPSYTQPVLDSMVSAGEEYLASVKQHFDGGLEIVARAEVGTPIQLLEEYIERNGIDLVVMTTHGRGGFGRAVLGSVTDRLIGFGPPVLVVSAAE